jgi:hypothetical protein
MLDLKRHNAQYPSIQVKQFDKAHDRFLILDNETNMLWSTQTPIENNFYNMWVPFDNLKTNYLRMKPFTKLEPL